MVLGCMVTIEIHVYWEGEDKIMNRKYDMRICKCGRIHMVPNEKIEKALKNNRNLLLICAGCGTATLIGGRHTARLD